MLLWCEVTPVQYASAGPMPESQVNVMSLDFASVSLAEGVQMSMDTDPQNVSLMVSNSL